MAKNNFLSSSSVYYDVSELAFLGQSSSISEYEMGFDEVLEKFLLFTMPLAI